MRCERCQDLMVEALYGELDEPSRKTFDEHVIKCESCAAVMAEMQGTLDTMSKHQRSNPGQAYWDGYWKRLSARMEDEQVTRGSAGVAWWRRNVMGGGNSRVSWAYRAAAVAAILVIGVFAGRTFLAPDLQLTDEPQVAVEQPVQEQSAPIPVDAKAAAADDRAMCYIEKSQMLLIALVNGDPSSPDAYAGGFSDQRRRSSKLVDEAGAIKDDLSGPRQRRLRALVADLEKILVQISNLESEEDVEAVEFIRSRVNDRDMLLKIDLEQMRHGTDVEGCAPGAARGSNSQRRID